MENNFKYSSIVDENGMFIITVIMFKEKNLSDAWEWCSPFRPIKAGERAVDILWPKQREHVDDTGLVRPQLNASEDGWVEGATPEELAAWELEHPAPPPPKPTEVQRLREQVKRLEAGQSAVAGRQDFVEDCIAEMAGQIYSV